jgi:hypothetical protein
MQATAIRAVTLLAIGWIATTLAVQLAIDGSLHVPATHFVPDGAALAVQAIVISLFIRRAQRPSYRPQGTETR